MIFPALAFLHQHRDPTREKKNRFAHSYLVFTMLGIWIGNFMTYTIIIERDKNVFGEYCWLSNNDYLLYCGEASALIWIMFGEACLSTLFALYFYSCLKSYAEFDEATVILYGQQQPGVNIYVQ